jgi:hypothetical protein
MKKAHDYENSVGNPSSREPQAGHQDRPGRWRRTGRFMFKLLLILGGLFLLMIVGLMLMSSFTLDGVENFRQNLDRFDRYIIIIRLLAIGILIGFWCPFNKWLAQIRGWPDEQLERALAGRWWALGVMMFVELVLVQRIHEILVGVF